MNIQRIVCFSQLGDQGPQFRIDPISESLHNLIFRVQVSFLSQMVCNDCFFLGLLSNPFWS